LSDVESILRATQYGRPSKAPWWRWFYKSRKAMTSVIVGKAVESASVEERRRGGRVSDNRQWSLFNRFVAKRVDQPPVALPQPLSANRPRRVGEERQMIAGN